MRSLALPFLFLSLTACASLQGRDPLVINVAGVEPLQSEGLELRMLVTLRILNPNDSPVEYDGAALDLDINGRRLASGVSDVAGLIPRYGESSLVIPVTISAFDVARQLIGYVNDSGDGEVSYRVRGKLQAGVLGVRRFSDEGAIQLGLPSRVL
ncbi:MAG TPA: LEA type 2 family protein [Gammaproteobacteria bacterium]